MALPSAPTPLLTLTGWVTEPNPQGRPAVTPLGFEVNGGQTDPAVKYIARGSRYLAFFLHSETVLSFTPDGEGHSAAIRMRLVGANAESTPTGEGELAGDVSYFNGNDPLRWHTGLPTYSRVRYNAIYPGIDLVFHGNPAQLEYDFRLDPGADPNAIAWEVSGADGLDLTNAGTLVVRVGNVVVSFPVPIVYQEEHGLRHLVAANYRLTEPNRVGFNIGRHDASRGLVIDPVIEYASYLGGSGTDRSFAPAIDAAGNMYVTGTTDAVDFPFASDIRWQNRGGFDVFVTKLSADGSTVLYSVYLGGAGRDQGFGIAVNSSGEVYVAGDTQSSDFPTRGAFQSFGGVQDAFVTKLSADGTSVVYSTYLGGRALDGAFDLRLDSHERDTECLEPFSPFASLRAVCRDPGRRTTAQDEQVVVSGITESDDFPIWRAAQPTRGGARDIFVAKLRTDGSGLAWATYLGGSLNEGNGAIWLDSAGNVFVAGQTVSTDFPVVNPLQSAYGGGTNDAFVSKIDARGRRLLFSTYLGGSGVDIGFAITVDPSDGATITGRTNSTDFPTMNPLQPRLGGGDDIFVAKLRPDLTGYVFATYLGGTGNENAFGIVADARGNIHLSGWSNSTNFPIANALQARNAGGDDAVFVGIDPLGLAFLYSTYFGGSGNDRADYIVADVGGSTYASGWTSSLDFPTRHPIQPRYAGGVFDAFVVKIRP
jgi:hypothetical protein